MPLNVRHKVWGEDAVKIWVLVHSSGGLDSDLGIVGSLGNEVASRERIQPSAGLQAQECLNKRDGSLHLPFQEVGIAIDQLPCNSPMRLYAAMSLQCTWNNSKRAWHKLRLLAFEAQTP
jgi:hypothetical protein